MTDSLPPASSHEAALQASEARYRQLYETMMDAFVQVDMSGKILEYNDAYRQMLGYKAGELAALNFWDITPQKWWAMEEGIIQHQILVRGYSDIYEKEYRRKDGSVIPVELRAGLLRDTEGHPQSMYAIVRDITERRLTELALAESKERYRQLFNGMLDGFALHEIICNEQDEPVDYRFLEVNPAYEHLTGLKATNLIGRTVLEVLPHLEKSWIERYGRVALTGEAAHFEDYVQELDRFYEVTAYCPQHGRFVVIFTDTSERKRAERILRQKTEELDQFFTVALDLLCIADTSGFFRMLNPTWEHVLGFRRQELLSHQFLDFVHPDDLEATQQAIATLAAQQKVINFVNRYRCKDGSYRWLEWRSAPGGELIYAAARDITARKEMEAELRQLNADLEARIAARTAELADLYNNAPCGYYSLDENGKFVRVNDTELRMLGYSREELLGQSFGDFLTAEGRRVFEGEFPQFKQRGWINNMEYEVMRKDGSLLQVTINALGELDAQGCFLRSRATMLDNTERKQAEAKIHQLNEELDARARKLEAANQELEAFSYSVSHDLKAPLRGIDGYSKLLQQDYGDQLDQEGLYYIAMVRQAAGQMAQLIDDLLAYSRLERSTLAARPIELEEVMDEVLAPLQDDLLARHVALKVALPGVKVYADRDGLKAALRNVIENALKFTQRVEAPQIEIGGQVNETTCQVWVRDNGIGFDMQYHDRIFEVFQRLQRYEDFPGTGIGLAIVRKAMQRMGGQVWAESQPGAGAVFYLEIPRWQG